MLNWKFEIRLWKIFTWFCLFGLSGTHLYTSIFGHICSLSTPGWMTELNCIVIDTDADKYFSLCLFSWTRQKHERTMLFISKVIVQRHKNRFLKCKLEWNLGGVIIFTHSCTSVVCLFPRFHVEMLLLVFHGGKPLYMRKIWTSLSDIAC